MRVTRIGVAGARAFAAGMPVTVVLVLLLWMTTIATGALPHGPSTELREAIGLNPWTLGSGRVWTLLSSGLVVGGWIRLLLDTGVLLLAGAVVERRIGAARTLLLVACTQLLGALLGCGMGLAVEATAGDTMWGLAMRTQMAVTPIAWIVGLLVAGSTVLPTLWRRRVRAVVLTLAVAMVLFTGQLPDLLILGGALAGLLVGRLMFGQVGAASPSAVGTVREVRTLVALIVAAGVLGPLLVAFGSDSVGPLWPLSQLLADPGTTPADAAALCEADRRTVECRTALQSVRLAGFGSALMTLAPAVGILIAAGALRTGLRFAYRGVVLVVLLLAVGSVALLLWDGTPVGGGVTADVSTVEIDGDTLLWLLSPMVAFVSLLVVLLAARRYFPVRLQRGALLRAAGLVAAIVLTGLVAYVLLGGLLGDGFDVHPSIASLAADYPTRLLPPLYLSLIDPSLLAVSGPARFLQSWIGVATIWPCLVVVWWALRSAPEGRDAESTARVRSLLHAPGGSTLSWMSTWDGNHYWFSADARAAVAYRVRAGVALTTGDPVAAVGERGSAAVEFAEHCHTQGWTPCLYSVDAEVRDALAGRGWGSVQVAEETVIPLPELEFRGKRFQDVRTALNRADKDGVTARWTSLAETPLGQVEQITAISEEWVADKGMPEMGFTLGGVEELHDPEVRLMLAVDADGLVQGVTSWMPVYRDGELVGLTLDFMRRRAGGFRPVMEFLIASTALRAKGEGLEFLSLSGAPLAHGSSEDSEGADRSALDSVLDGLGRSLEPVYGFRSLLSFKAKFQPEYRPLYLCYPDAAALLAIGVAVGRAYLPDVELGQGARLLGKLARR